MPASKSSNIAARQMILKYKLSIEDLAAFTRYHSANSPIIRRTKQATMFFVSSFLIVGSLLVSPIGGVSRPIIVGLAVVGAVSFCVFFSYRFPAHITRVAQRVLTKEQMKDDSGERELELDDEGLTVRTERNDTRHPWSSIDQIVESDGHAFIYILSLGATVIPKHSIVIPIHSVTRGDADAFLSQARKLWQASIGISTSGSSQA